MRSELCELLDSQIPLKGVLQAYYRNQVYLEGIIRDIVNSGF